MSILIDVARAAQSDLASVVAAAVHGPKTPAIVADESIRTAPPPAAATTAPMNAATLAEPLAAADAPFEAARQIVGPAKFHVSAEAGLALNDVAIYWTMRNAGDPRATGYQKLASQHSAAARREAAKAMFGHAAAARAEFPSEEAFAGYLDGCISGQVRIASGGARRDPLAGLPSIEAGEAAWKAAYASGSLRAEFRSEDIFLAYMRGEARLAARRRH